MASQVQHWLFKQGTGQNCKKTKLHEGNKQHEKTKLNKDNFARRYFCRKTNMHEGILSHKGTQLYVDNFAGRVFFAREVQNNSKKSNKDNKNKKKKTTIKIKQNSNKYK